MTSLLARLLAMPAGRRGLFHVGSVLFALLEHVEPLKRIAGAQMSTVEGVTVLGLDLAGKEIPIAPVQLVQPARRAKWTVARLDIQRPHNLMFFHSCMTQGTTSR